MLTQEQSIALAQYCKELVNQLLRQIGQSTMPQVQHQIPVENQQKPSKNEDVNSVHNSQTDSTYKPADEYSS